jgi:MFS family permease
MFFVFAAFSASQYHTWVMEFQKGFAPKEVGTFMMIGALNYMLAPFVLRGLNKLGIPSKYSLGFLLLLQSILLLCYPHTESFFITALCFSGMALLNYTNSSMVTSTALFATSQNTSNTAKKSNGSFLFSRSMGTAGFALLCALSAFLIGSNSIQYSPTDMYPIFAFLAFAAALISFFGPNVLPKHDPETSLLKVVAELKKPPFPILILLISIANACAFAGASLTGNFISSEMKLDESIIGSAWTLATAVEIPLIWLGILLVHKLDLRYIFAMGALSTGLKLLITALSYTPSSILIAQIFHGFHFGVSIAAFGILVKRIVAPDRVVELMLWSSLIYTGLATSIGGKLSGLIWDLAGLRILFFSMGLLCFISAGSLLFLKKEHFTEKKKFPLES